MTLYLIGLGLNDEKDISIKGLEIIKKCHKIYLENYTSLLQCSVEDLEKFYQKKIILANREMSEQKAAQIVDQAREQEIAFLVIGDSLSATTHIELFKLAKGSNIPVKVINNVSVLTAVGITGLQLYKFGRITSIPYLDNFPLLETPYRVLEENQKQGLHTLMLLDIKAEEDRFMTINEAIKVLEDIESRKGRGLISDETLIVGCARLGSDDYMIKSGKLGELKKVDFGAVPHCLIIPGRMHFVEEEMMEVWK